jgi:hypothetical protein
MGIPIKDNKFMYGALSISLLLILDASAIAASSRPVSQPFSHVGLSEGFFPEAPVGSNGNVFETLPAMLQENLKEDLAAYVESIQEWNQLISQKFRDIPEAALSKQEAFDFDSMSDKLNSLEFGALNSHLAALHKYSRVIRYLAAQRRAKRRLLAIAKTRAPLLAVNTPPEKRREKLHEKPQVLAQANSSPGMLEDAHTQLTLTYPDLFADRMDLSSAHPTALDSGKNATRTSLETRRRSYVEAFDSQSSVLDGWSEMLSREPGETGWFLSSGYQHLPTLEWVGDSQKDLETPLISENTARMLSTLAGASIQKDAGIVFGKLAPGWRIDFSGRADIPIYLDSNLRVVTSEDVGTERYFVFLNAAPGAHLVYLSNVVESGSGAVAFPIMGGTATYLDLAHMTYTGFSGHVVLTGVDGQEMRPLSRATVRLVGQAPAAGVTNGKGYFRFDNVLIVSDYPVFVETDKGAGFTHRYRILPKNLQDLTLFRLSKNQINDWIGQIEGGVSSDSGLLLAAVPGVVADQPNVTLVPSVRSIAPTLRMIPETYTLTPTDLLQPRTALERDENRFLGVEVPEGPVLAQVVQLAGEKKTVIWSELTFVSPNVITLVGPY